MTFKPLPLMSVLALLGLAVLIYLGSWQWSRYVEKSNRSTETPAFEEIELFTPTLPGAMSQQVYGLYEGQATWRRYVPVARDRKGPGVGVALYDILVATEPEALPPARYSLGNRVEVLRLPGQPDRGFGLPSDVPEENKWFAVDATRLLDQMQVEARADTLYIFEPRRTVFVDPELRLTQEAQSLRANPWADPTLLDSLPPARHLGYAITWFGLALTLIGVYIAFHVREGRLRVGRSDNAS